MTKKDQNRLLRSLLVPLIFPALMWIVFLTLSYFKVSPAGLGILPRNLTGLMGIVTAPLAHADFSHIFSNTVPLVILGWAIFFFYPKVSYKVFVIVYFLTGILVWSFARQLYHIGASGIVYAFMSFLFFSGLFRRDNKSIALALIVVFLYGGIVWGILPGQKGISWESHLFGGIAGVFAAFVLRRVDPPKKYEWEDEPDDYNVDELEVSYDPEKNKFNL